MDLGLRRRQALAGLLAAGWLVAAIVAALAYRPGGPLDLAPAALRVAVAGLAAAAVLRPPPAAVDRWLAASWLAAASLLILAPSIWLLDRRPVSEAVPLLPSPETLYPWFLAALGTGVYAGLGLVGARPQAAARGGRWVVARGVVIGAVVALAIATLGGAAVFANDAALASDPPAASRYGPTGASPQPPPCDGELAAGAGALVTMDLSGTVDRTDIGAAALAGERDGADFSWTATVATTITQGGRGASRLSSDGWLLGDDGTWQPAPAAALDPLSLDLRVVETALSAANRAVPETLGIDLVEGARARHCQAAVDGPTFLEAFPQTAWFIGDVEPETWRGWIDWWVFADGELGLLGGYIDGLASEMTPPGIRVTVRVRLSATDRDLPHPVSPPEPRE